MEVVKIVKWKLTNKLKIVTFDSNNGKLRALSQKLNALMILGFVSLTGSLN